MLLKIKLSTRFKLKTILVIEDNYYLSRAFKDLRDYPLNKFSITTCRNKKEFEDVRHKKFDVVLCDWYMGDEHGHYYLNRAKANNYYVMTGFPINDELRGYLQLCPYVKILNENSIHKITLNDLAKIFKESK